jgi:hypothetical protein
MAASREQAGECARRLCLATARPVLTQVRVGWTAVERDGVAPRVPRDVLAGQPLVVAVELKKVGGTLEIQALGPDGRERVWSIEVPDVAGSLSSAPALSRTSISLGALFGREAIADVEARVGSVRPRENADDIVEKLGMRHRIVSRRTSMVAVAEEPTVDPLAPRRREKLAVELPAGVSAAGVGLGVNLMDTGALPLDALMFRSAGPPPLYRRPTGMVGDLPEDSFDIGYGEAAPDDHEKASESAWLAERISSRGPDLTIEFEVEEDGFELPDEGIVVGSRTGPARKAKVVPQESSPRGPHSRGTRVRLTLRLADGRTWSDDEVAFIWRDGPSKGESGRILRILPGRADT